ncbi:coiled-coil domain-containing protein 149 [Aplysia californica]|uniref:Coiled-coil domain-containing protein 149 n=1 Tax=Aplysia californica TaxID=6500 RepID=A0ABM1A8X6_APLCA|nr:coiled-coil domain-containing protein 149 [Aplysia californica]
MTAADAASASLSSRLDSITTEYQICRRKLESKCEALLILSKELHQCRSERDQFKLMAEQVRDRYQMVKRQLTGDTPMSPSHADMDPKTFSDIQTQSLARLLFDTKENNKSLKFEVDDLRQKLQDAEGDIKLLREQIARSRVGTTDEGLNTRHFPAHEREDLVRQLEASREEYVQLERDLQQVLDEKEELVTERDAYRTKYERLNTELNYILGGDEKRIVDIDALSMENKYLQERLKQMEEEKTMAIATVTKYKSILEKKKTKGIMKLGQSRSGGLVITQKQVQEIMQSRSSITPTPQALADLQGLCAALLDTINDKNLALSHQRKTNKLLGNRVNELEKKLKTLEVSGLWSVSGNLPNLEKLKAECAEIKTLVPRQYSQSTDASEQLRDVSDLDSELSSSEPNSAQSSPAHNRHTLNELSRLDLEELDLLPTKEEVVKGEKREAEPVSCSGSGLSPLALTSPPSTPSILDSAIGVSDMLEESSPGQSGLLSDQRLGLLAGEKETPDYDRIRAKLLQRDSGEDLQSDDDDSHNLSERLEHCLEKDVEDIKDSEGIFEGFEPHCQDDLFQNEEDDDDDDDCVGASEEFKSLIECVTAKLIERSHQIHPPGKNAHAADSCRQTANPMTLSDEKCRSRLPLDEEVDVDMSSAGQRGGRGGMEEVTLVSGRGLQLSDVAGPPGTEEEDEDGGSKLSLLGSQSDGSRSRTDDVPVIDC